MRDLVRRACEALGVRRLVLGVHDAALPADLRDDLGRGAPRSLGGRAFLRFAADLGFDGLQLGPQGETSAVNASPYDGTIFSRSTLSIAAGPLVEAGLLAAESLAEAVAARPAGSIARADHRHVHAVQQRLLDEAFARYSKQRPAALVADLRDFANSNREWLSRDGLYAALQAEHGEPDWLRWPEADRRLFHPLPEEAAAAAARIARLRALQANAIERHAFAQWLAHRQHAAFHAEAQGLRIRLYGDLQIGVGHQDIWSHGALFLAGFRLGAPPSRTNPEGQPWSYAVLDPALYGTSDSPGPAMTFARCRVDKLLAEFDGLRLDHPHGLIDPWVYRAAQVDQLKAVRAGARLFSSPDLPDLPELAALAIATAEQLDRSLQRHADGWVRSLGDEQVDRYSRLFDVVVAAARAHGREVGDLVAEVLSTLPYPIGRVLARHGLGRFRVTQKASLTDPADVYRSENAAPADWVMTGNHDTPSVWRAAEKWTGDRLADAHGAHLASRLIAEARDRPRAAAALSRTPERLALGRLAELFVGPGRQISIFFTDLFGLREAYNRPGVISDDNWSLRVPAGFARSHAEAARRGSALDLPRALALAMKSRGRAFSAPHAALVRELEAIAGPDPTAG